MTDERQEELVKCFNDFTPAVKRDIYAFLLQAQLLDDEHTSLFTVLLSVTEVMQKQQPEVVKAACNFCKQLNS
jgi:hypothetical protein